MKLTGELERVQNWREKVLLEAGLSAEDARLAAFLNEIDLHEIVALVRRGCPPEVALRILL